MPAVASKYCPECGQEVPHKARFCGDCGNPLQKSDVASPSDPPCKSAADASWTKLPMPKMWGSARTWLSYLGAAFAVLVLFGILMEVVFPGPQTIPQFLESERARIEKGLNEPGNDFGKRIESIHLTVTYAGASVKSLVATSIDGSNNAGHNGSNISEMEIVITAYWQGFFEKKGYTEIKTVYDYQAKQVKSTTYLNSNAIINTATVDWFKVGWVIGQMIGASLAL